MSRRDGQAPPMIGALLRYAWQGVRAQILDGLQAAGFTDLRAPHLDVFQHPGPEGARPGDLAERARTTKQAMNQLLRSLEELGYVERRSPSAKSADGRARAVHLTPRGVRAAAAIRDVLLEIEAAWAARLGASRFADIKAALEEMRGAAER
ncbi:MAG TPA: MarR family transcriptional regulator [Gemmatimonadaceae bacterium]|nr:MarR family transcriptional regulator [Gemmatimonadaceae bacterium]